MSFCPSFKQLRLKDTHYIYKKVIRIKKNKGKEKQTVKRRLNGGLGGRTQLGCLDD